MNSSSAGDLSNDIGNWIKGTQREKSRSPIRYIRLNWWKDLFLRKIW